MGGCEGMVVKVWCEGVRIWCESYCSVMAAGWLGQCIHCSACKDEQITKNLPIDLTLAIRVPSTSSRQDDHEHRTQREAYTCIKSPMARVCSLSECLCYASVTAPKP